MKRRMAGLISMSLGVGMLLMFLLTLFTPYLGFLLASLLVVFGFLKLFG